MWFIPWHLLYAIWILWDTNYFGAKLQVFSSFLSWEKRVSVERNAAPHSHNFPNLETHQNPSETFFAEFSRSNQNTLTFSAGIWGNGILDEKRNHITASFTRKNKLKVSTWKTITPPFSKILLVARRKPHFCCDVTMARHIRQLRPRVYDSCVTQSPPRVQL